ncbi:MAG: hypothetical protein PHS49_02435 [Candidatus Gracilibacteria bacterium]|nr:hypothetical protein [Candidatus Gracilibacteria bacterium]
MYKQKQKGKKMKTLKLLVLAVVLSFSSQLFAEEGNVVETILEAMYAEFDNLLVNKVEHKVSVDGDTLTVKKEIVFIKNGIRYTVWDVEKDVVTSVLRVYYSDNNDKSNKKTSGSFEMDADTGDLLYYFTNDHSVCYSLTENQCQTLNTADALNLVQAHINNLNEFLGIE